MKFRSLCSSSSPRATLPKRMICSGWKRSTMSWVMAWMVSRLRGLRRRASGLDGQWGFGVAGCRGVHAGRDRGFDAVAA